MVSDGVILNAWNSKFWKEYYTIWSEAILIAQIWKSNKLNIFISEFFTLKCFSY